MAITDRYAIAGVQAWIARAGATSTSPSGLVSAALKPDAGDAAWVSIPHISNLRPSRTGQKDIIRKPLPGRARAVKVKEYNVDLFYRFTLEMHTPLLLELSRGAGALTASVSQFNQLEGFDLECWLKFQFYDSDETLFLTEDVWTHLSSTGEPSYDPESEHTTLDVEAMVLHSAYNTSATV